MGSSPVLLIGSRGTGKTTLLRVAELILLKELEKRKVLPIFVSYNQSALIDPKLFKPWMISKILFQIKIRLSRLGYVSTSKDLFTRYTGLGITDDELGDRLLKFNTLLENSWKNGCGFTVNDDQIVEILGEKAEYFTTLNEIDIFKEIIRDICVEYGFAHINVFFDEAAHNFYPLQQREFFSIFRDMRSPYFCGIASVYPGLTSYGHTFQSFHDVTKISLVRTINSSGYVEMMEEIITKRVDDETWKKLKEQGDILHTLIYAASGNPRLLFKSLLVATDNLQKRLQVSRVNEVIRSFYRSDIWNEHTRLSDIYLGHRSLIDWGRSFIENSVLPETKIKNDARREKKIGESTLYFVLHRDAPESVKAAMRILEYTGIINLIDEGVKMTRSELGTRYFVNFGCILAQEINPVTVSIDIRHNLSLNKFTEYGINHAAFKDININWSSNINGDINEALGIILSKSLNCLELSIFQKNKLIELKLKTIGDILSASEEGLQQAQLIGLKRARTILSVATNAALEYISG